MTLQDRLLENIKKPLVLAHLAFSGLYFVFAFLGSWAKRKEGSYGAFEFFGGTGLESLEWH